MRRPAVVILAMLALPAAAHAQTDRARTVKVVAGRVYMRPLAYPDYTTISQLVVWAAQPHSKITLRCTGGKCPLGRHATTVGRTGIVTFKGALLAKRLPVGRKLVIEIAAPNRFVDRYTYRVRASALSQFTESCATPSGSHRSCTASCGSGGSAPRGRCKDVGFELGTRIAWAYSYDATGTKLTGLTFSGVPKGATIAVFCTGTPCPFGIDVRFFAAATATFDLGPPLIGRDMQPGSELQAYLLRANAIGNVVTLRPQPDSAPIQDTECLYPAERKPRACPTPP